jgi:hypothetical protein
MQLCNITVAIGGEAGMTVHKERVTVPEIMILRAVHGEDAVRNIEVIEDADIDASEERSRLGAVYKNPETIVRDVLGAHGNLPKTLDEAGIDDEFIVSNSVAKTKKSKKASATEELKVPQDDANTDAAA